MSVHFYNIHFIEGALVILLAVTKLIVFLCQRNLVLSFNKLLLMQGLGNNSLAQDCSLLIECPLSRYLIITRALHKGERVCALRLSSALLML